MHLPVIEFNGQGMPSYIQEVNIIEYTEYSQIQRISGIH